MPLTTVQSAVFRRRDSEASFKGLGQVTLVGKACGNCDFTQQRVRGDDLFGRKVQAQTPDIFADGATILFSKDAGQMYRMNAGGFGRIVKAEG